MKKEISKNLTKDLEKMTRDIFDQGVPLHAVTGVAEEELEAMYALAYSYYQQNKLEKAKSMFGFLCLQNSLKPKYWQGLAASCKMLKEYENSIKSYGVLVLLEDKKEKETEATLEIVECYIAMHNLPAAADIFQELLATNQELLKVENPLTQRVKTLADHLNVKKVKANGK